LLKPSKTKMNTLHTKVQYVLYREHSPFLLESSLLMTFREIFVIKCGLI
jgi:hypothetical protein